MRTSILSRTLFYLLFSMALLPCAEAYAGSHSGQSHQRSQAAQPKMSLKELTDIFGATVILTKEDLAKLQEILENGSTGVTESWETSNGYERRATPQPPHPLADGTVLREIEVLNVDGRYERVLFLRWNDGVWLFQNHNLGYWRSVQEGAIKSELSDHIGFFKWHCFGNPMLRDKIIRAFMDIAPYPPPHPSQAKEQAHDLVRAELWEVMQRVAPYQAAEEERTRVGANPGSHYEEEQARIRVRTAAIINEWK